MKFSDIINTELSLYNSLGHAGGKALPSNKKPKRKKKIQIWNRNRLVEYQRGPDLIKPTDKGANKFNIGNGTSPEDEFGSWAKSPRHTGDSKMIRQRGKPNKKVMVRKVGKNSIETIDDEGNHKILTHTGPIDYRKMGTGGRTRYQNAGQLPESSAGTGTGLGGSGATMPPQSGPAELEYDLDYVDKEFKGKDTRAEIKTSKKKRERLKQYLQRRQNGETIGNS